MKRVDVMKTHYRTFALEYSTYHLDRRPHLEKHIWIPIALFCYNQGEKITQCSPKLHVNACSVFTFPWGTSFSIFLHFPRAYFQRSPVSFPWWNRIILIKCELNDFITFTYSSFSWFKLFSTISMSLSFLVFISNMGNLVISLEWMISVNYYWT